MELLDSSQYSTHIYFTIGDQIFQADIYFLLLSFLIRVAHILQEMCLSVIRIWARCCVGNYLHLKHSGAFFTSVNGVEDLCSQKSINRLNVYVESIPNRFAWNVFYRIKEIICVRQSIVSNCFNFISIVCMLSNKSPTCWFLIEWDVCWHVL